MEFKGNRGKNIYTLTVNEGVVQSILVEVQDSWDRTFYQRGPVSMGLIIDEMIFEEAVVAICQKKFILWKNLYEAMSRDVEYGQYWLMKIFEKHLN